MPSKKATVKFTANFEVNLESVAAFWTENGAPLAFDQLLDELGGAVIPNLECFPTMVRRFLARPGRSVEVIARMNSLSRQCGVDQLREYLCGDYLILYTLIDKTVYLLAIQHHKQLSFDFHALWNASSDARG